MGFAGTAPWELWAQDAANLADKATLRTALQSAAAKWSLVLHRNSRRDSRSDEWDSLRVEVVQTNMGASGGCRLRQGYATVYVNREDGLQRRRYTVAHEVGHLFLQSGKLVQNLCLSAYEEENLCDEFANHLLVSRALLGQQLDGLRDFHPEDLSSLANGFCVNLTPMVIAVSERWNPAWGILILAKKRAHPRTSGDVEFRVEACATATPWYVPKYATLTKLGLGDAIDALTADDAHPLHATGEVSRFAARLWEPGAEARRSGRAHGSAKWVGRRFGPTIVLVVQPLKVDYRWYRRLDSDR